MKQIKTLLAALFVAMAGTASAQLTNYVHITKTDGTKIELSQAEIQSMTIDTKAPAEELKFVTFTDGTNTVTVANMNLGATSVAKSPETCYGDYYAWGATTTFATVNLSTGTVSPTKEGGYTEANAPADFADVVTAKMGTGYHMPTQAEMQTLYEACGGNDSYTPTGEISADQAYPTTAGIYWVTGGNTAVKIGDDTYSVNGILFVQDADTHVFFPAAGGVNGTSLYFAGFRGFCWSSSLSTGNTNFAYNLSFRSGDVNPGNGGNRYYGFPVRPFKD